MYLIKISKAPTRGGYVVYRYENCQCIVEIARTAGRGRTVAGPVRKKRVPDYFRDSPANSGFLTCTSRISNEKRGG